MVRFIVVRILQSLIALLGISILIFILVRASGDPTNLMRTPTSTEADIQNIRVHLGLEKSYPEQYWIFIKSLAHGDLGTSIKYNTKVTDMIGESLPNTLRLAIFAFLISVLLSLFLGVIAATHKDTILDNIVKFIAVLGQALPGFWVAIMAIFIFSVHWRLLPPVGIGDWTHYVIPVSTLSLFMIPGMMRLVRSSLLDVLDSEYVKLARIKGLPERIVVWKHALRNALIAPLTTAGMLFAMLITGEVIIETVFAWPGMGRTIVDGVMSRDFPVVQGVTLAVAVLVLGVNLVVDILYAYVDPQIRYQKT